MSERPPNEVAAAPVHGIDCASRNSQPCDCGLDHELADRAPTQWAYEQVCKARDKWQGRAETAERELSEARAALEKAEGERDRSRGYGVEETLRKEAAEREVARLLEINEGLVHDFNTLLLANARHEDREKAAEASCREHAEAIGVLRAALDGVMAVVAANNSKRGWNSMSTPDEIVHACALLSQPEGVLASRLSAERRAEREVRDRIIDLARLVSSQSYADPDGGWDAKPIVGHALVHTRRQLVIDIHAAVKAYDEALAALSVVAGRLSVVVGRLSVVAGLGP